MPFHQYSATPEWGVERDYASLNGKRIPVLGKTHRTAETSVCFLVLGLDRVIH